VILLGISHFYETRYRNHSTQLNS